MKIPNVAAEFENVKGVDLATSTSNPLPNIYEKIICIILYYFAFATLARDFFTRNHNAESSEPGGHGVAKSGHFNRNSKIFAAVR